MKKVKCIENEGKSCHLTIGKIYNVVKDDSYIYVIDDRGIQDWFSKTRFEEVKGEKPKTFAITGKPKLLEAIAEDLVSLGYNLDADSRWRRFEEGILCTNLNTVSNTSIGSIRNFKHLITIESMQSFDNTFNLPEDYSKVLEHAKEALNPENWEEQDQIKIGQYPAQFIGNTVTFGCKTNITLEEAQALRTVFTLSGRVGNVNFEQEETFCIDGNEIQVDILDKVIKKLKDG